MKNYGSSKNELKKLLKKNRVWINSTTNKNIYCSPQF